MCFQKVFKLGIIAFCIISFSSLWSASLKQIQELYQEGNKDLALGRYEEAGDSYKKMEEFLEDFSQWKPYFSFYYYQIPIQDIVKKRAALGKLHNPYIHKIKVIYLMRTSVTVPDKKGGRVRVDVKLEQSDLEETKTFLGMFKVYIEVLSAGRMSLAYSFKEHKNPLTLMNEFTASDYEGKTYHSRYPELNSVDGLGKEIFSSLPETDTFLFYYKSKGTDPRPVGGADFLPVIPYFLNAPLRGRLLIPVEYRNAGVLLHEFFHSLENLSGIRPGHGFLPGERKIFPDWKGEGQYDYYRWHFEHTLLKHGFDKLSFLDRYPLLMGTDNYEKANKVAAGISLFKRLNAVKAYRAGEELEKKGQAGAALLKYRESLRWNPYHSQSLAKMVSQAMAKKAYQEASLNIERGLALEPRNTFFLYYQGVIHYHNKKPLEAVKSMTAAIQADPRMDKAYYYRGFLYLIQKNFPQAEEDFLKAASLSESYKKLVLDFLSKYLNSPVYQEAVKGMMEKIEGR